MIEKLKGFSPTVGFDRDEMLFQAGRASVRSPRVWPWLCALLVATQAVTLSQLRPGPRVPPETVIVEVPAPSPAPPSAIEPTPAPPVEPTSTPDPMSYIALTRVYEERGALPTRHVLHDPSSTPSAPLTAGASRTFID